MWEKKTAFFCSSWYDYVNGSICFKSMLHLSCSFSLFHQEYIDNILKRENKLEEMNVKEPRTEEEKENAASLLELIIVRKIKILTSFNKTLVLRWKCELWNILSINKPANVRVARFWCRLVVKQSHAQPSAGLNLAEHCCHLGKQCS